MKNLFKTLKEAVAVSLIILTAVLPAFADTTVASLTAATPANVLSAPELISNISILATTTNNTTVIFYDTTGTSTNYVQAAYTSYVSYATNYDVVFTNSASILVTNTFRGRYTAPVVNTISTNQRPKMITIIVPASAQYSSDVQLHPLKGLTLLADHAATVTLTYQHPQ